MRWVHKPYKLIEHTYWIIFHCLLLLVQFSAQHDDYDQNFPVSEALQAEYASWKRKWRTLLKLSVKYPPKTGSDGHLKCPESIRKKCRRKSSNDKWPGKSMGKQAWMLTSASLKDFHVNLRARGRSQNLWLLELYEAGLRGIQSSLRLILASTVHLLYQIN